MRIPVTLSLFAIAGCGNVDSDEPRAPVSSFVPPSPAGCAGATAYDACFANEGGTPLAIRVILPPSSRTSAIATVHFRRVWGERNALDLDQMKFKVGDQSELLLYFQVHPGGYRIAVGVDADGDGDPNGANDDLGWSATSPSVPVVDEMSAAIVDVGTLPITTAFTLAPRH